MKQKFIITLLVLAAVLVGNARETTKVIDGVRYNLRGREVSCVVEEKDKQIDVVLLETIKFDNLDYYLTSIEKKGFMGCKKMRSIVIPNSVKKFGEHAFWNCSSLESVVMPDEAESRVAKGNYGVGTGGIFRGCKKLTRARGTTLMYPRYMVYDSFNDCKEVPFYSTILETGSAEMTKVQLTTSFAEFAMKRIKAPVENWQRKQEYETVAKWESRVNEAARKRMIDEALAEARKEYLEAFAPVTLHGTLEDYNSDFGFYPVFLGNLGTIYAKVDPADADNFRRHWDKVTLTPEYGILDDKLAVLSCSFSLDGKHYAAAQTYKEDEIAEVAMGITPLAAVREYHRDVEAGLVSATPSKSYEIDAVDLEIPVCDVANSNTFAVIIGNENYQRVDRVDYAMNDARIFEKYCRRTLGLPESNIRSYYDATYGDIVTALEDIKNICMAYNGDARVIFYYAGHGMPDESTRKAYLMPVDAIDSNPQSCYELSSLYTELSSLKSSSVVAFIDACFSGSKRGEGMLMSSRGMRLRPRALEVSGNLVVVSAASADQTALPYPEKGHGIFTYYLLDKLRQTGGEVALGELTDHIISNVSRQSVVENRKPQTPSVKYSPALETEWQKIRLK